MTNRGYRDNNSLAGAYAIHRKRIELRPKYCGAAITEANSYKEVTVINTLYKGHRLFYSVPPRVKNTLQST